MKYKVSFSLDFKRNKYKGKFIAIEGIDGSGKTIQSKMVVEQLKKKGYKAVLTKEPTDGVIGKFIKNDVLSGKAKIPPVAIQYLFSADRAVHQEEIENYLKKGFIVVTDRYFWSAVCYGISDIPRPLNYYLTSMSILSMYNQFLNTDTTFFLDISIKTALKRIGKSSKHNEIYDNEEKLKKIKKAYDFLKKRFAKEFVVVNAEKSVEGVTQDLVKRIETKVKSQKSKVKI
ncbi:dTMP kinase [Patescibacteria group bacterium]|nr:dTMP kinase [Patescibacteria group bacterium]